MTGKTVTVEADELEHRYLRYGAPDRSLLLAACLVDSSSACRLFVACLGQAMPLETKTLHRYVDEVGIKALAGHSHNGRRMDLSMIAILRACLSDLHWRSEDVRSSGTRARHQPNLPDSI